MNHIQCPECRETVPVAGCIHVDVTLSMGSESGRAGSSSTASASLCGRCGQALLGKYTQFAVDQVQEEAKATAAGR